MEGAIKLITETGVLGALLALSILAIGWMAKIMVANNEKRIDELREVLKSQSEVTAAMNSQAAASEKIGQLIEKLLVKGSS